MQRFKFFGVGLFLVFTSLVRAESGNYFWMAVKTSDQIAIVSSQKHGRDLKVSGLLSKEKWNSKISFPSWFVWQVRKDGEYLLPVSKKADSYIITGKNYIIPAMDKLEESSYEKLFDEYKILKPEAEKTFLKKLINEGKYLGLDFTSIRRLSGLGEFAKVMAEKDCEFWSGVYLQKTTNIGTKRFLLYELSRNNFLNCIDTYKSALRTPELSALAGNIFVRKDKKEFENLMLEWLADEKLRKFALVNSENMVKNAAYVNEAMKYFKPEDKQNFKYLIPVICASDDVKAQKIIKDFLIQNKNPKDFVLQLSMLKGINNSNSKAYAKELKVFLKNHKNNRFIMNGAAYPTILACLCKAGDADGYKLTLEYISNLKPDSKQAADKAKVNNFMRVFYCYNPKLRKVEKIKEDIESKLTSAKKS
jgi:hypothetical protein